MGPYDLVVIGGGSAGLTAARTAGRLGARTLLVERDRLGGDCLWTGCVPSKALLHVAGQVQAARGAARWGLSPAPLGPADLASAMAHVREAIGAIEPHDSAESLSALGVEVVGGGAVFTGPRTLRAGDRKITFRYALIATGSAPSPAPVPGLAEAEPLTSDTVWDLTELPARLVVLGGGPTGCELGQAFARLGSRVTLVEARERLLPGEEPEASGLVRERLEAEGVRVRTGWRAAEVAEGTVTGGTVSGSAVSGSPGGEPLAYDALLVVTGRRANTAALGCGEAGVALGARGAVRVDRRLRSTNPRVYAAGDVTGLSAVTHLGGVQGAAAAVDALLGVRRPVGYGAVPQVTFTDPEVGRVGLTAAQARERHGDAVRVHTVTHDRVDRAIAEGRTDGFTRLVLGPRGRIVGATVVAPRAGETMAHLTAAVRLGWTASRYAATVHPYPSYADGPWHTALSEVHRRLAAPGVRRATDALLGLRRAVHPVRRRGRA
ncbi:FAD-dependent oxidoreductase [Streptomyces sp. N2-109]|uniref:FAD-dependent oxidoreductase n=1 Tax=Streptomyces gossypii TaxID=2883101 RepID=A0ABT2JMM1_9ACTN|nr:FAD-dependent oxidoreductase [Streptomyces gossypii]MCT2589131.1 FAD-dependent oxidoreductase [Streptomyces gossypii]